MQLEIIYTKALWHGCNKQSTALLPRILNTKLSRKNSNNQHSVSQGICVDLIQENPDVDWIHFNPQLDWVVFSVICPILVILLSCFRLDQIGWMRVACIGDIDHELQPLFLIQVYGASWFWSVDGKWHSGDHCTYILHGSSWASFVLLSSVLRFLEMLV